MSTDHVSCLRKYFEHMMAKNLEGAVSYHAAGAHFGDPKKPYATEDKAKEWYREAFAKDERVIGYQIHYFKELNADAFYVEFSLTYKPREGRPWKVFYRSTEVGKVIDGEWRSTHSHWDSTRPLAVEYLEGGGV